MGAQPIQTELSFGTKSVFRPPWAPMWVGPMLVALSVPIAANAGLHAFVGLMPNSVKIDAPASRHRHAGESGYSRLSAVTISRVLDTGFRRHDREVPFGVSIAKRDGVSRVSQPCRGRRSRTHAWPSRRRSPTSNASSPSITTTLTRLSGPRASSTRKDSSRVARFSYSGY